MPRILLADDHNLFREALGHLLAVDPSIEVVGQAADASSAVALTQSLRPDVVLLDLSMAGMSSIEAIRQIKQIRPETRVLIVSMYDDEEFVNDAMQAGASGYVLKDVAGSELVKAVIEIARGGSYLTPRLLSRMMEGLRSGRGETTGSTRLASLTPRERETLKLLAEGKTVKEIAAEWGLSVKTAEVHKSNLMRKLDIHNKAQLVRYAIEKKVVHVDPMRPK